MEKYIEQNGITYELRGEQYYPLLELPEQKEIGKYGRMHIAYLKEHRKGRYTNLLSEGTLNQRLYDKRVMASHHENLEKSFTDEQKETFEKFHDCWSEYMSLAEAAIFEYALKLGVQIAVETLTE